MDRDEIKMITKISYMYYVQDEVQSKIAKKFNITRQMVSRLLQKAKDEGIVEININSPLKSVSALESELENKYGLKDAIVIQEDTISEEQLLQKLGMAAGEYFLDSVMSHMKVGIGIGKTLESLAEYVSQSAVSESISGVTLAQMIGGLYSNNSYENSQYIISMIGKKMKAELLFLNMPFMVEDSKEKEAILKHPANANVFNAYDELDMGIVEIKPANQIYRTKATQESKYGLNYLTSLGISYLNNVDTEGEVCLNYLNDRGKFIDTQLSDKVIGIHYKQLAGVKNLVGIVGGESSHKIAKSALKSGVFNAIVTDDVTARYILNDK